MWKGAGDGCQHDLLTPETFHAQKSTTTRDNLGGTTVMTLEPQEQGPCTSGTARTLWVRHTVSQSGVPPACTPAQLSFSTWAGDPLLKS